MKKEKKNNLSEEHIRKIKYRIGYKINESAKYYPLVNDNEEFDNIPSLTNEAGEQEDAQKPEGNMPTEPSNDQPMNTDAPVPEFDKTNGDSGDIPIDTTNNSTTEAPISEPEQQVDNIQNDIIKHNIEAMKNIHDQLNNLNNVVQGLNSKIDTLNSDVEEVREPTNSEKLMSKKNVSYPYYFNLNDLWSGNWFNEKREKENEKGIKELPDGTFVADFDDLPQVSKTDVQNSFNETI